MLGLSRCAHVPVHIAAVFLRVLLLPTGIAPFLRLTLRHWLISGAGSLPLNSFIPATQRYNLMPAIDVGCG